MQLKLQWNALVLISLVSLVACASKPPSQSMSPEPTAGGSSLDAPSAAPARSAPPKMKMTTEVPEGLATPDRLETRIGTLTSFDGVPDKRTVEIVYDNLDFQRATQAFLSSLQIASLDAMRRATLELGPANTTVVLFEQLMDSKSLFLTPNTSSVYMMT